MGKDSGSPPTPVDPFTQASAQYGLDTGTAQFNAGLNRTNATNPLGSTTWTANYPASPQGGGGYTPNTNYGAPSFGLPGMIPGIGPISIPGYGTPSASDPRGGAPTYTQNTSLSPQVNAQLQQPIDTSQIVGAPGGGSVYQGNRAIQDALYREQSSYLDPQFAQSDDQLKSQLAGQGIMPGSAAYQNALDQQNRNKTFSYGQARDSAITGATGQEVQRQGMGIQGLNANIAARNAPINEFESLLGGGGGSATAQTPDISGAFGQQYQGALAGYNANVSSNNQTSSDIGGLLAAALIAF